MVIVLNKEPSTPPYVKTYMPKKKTDLDFAIEIEEGNYLHAKGCGYTERARQRKRMAGWLKELKANRKELAKRRRDSSKACSSRIASNRMLVEMEQSLKELESAIITKFYGTKETDGITQVEFANL